jgi:hypothetical protein
MRTKISWPTTVQVPAKNDAPATGPLEATLVDLSMQGAMIKTESALATVGDKVKLCIEVTFEGAPAPLNLVASICHNNRSMKDDGFYIGLAFTNLSHQDKLLLNFATQAPQSL